MIIKVIGKGAWGTSIAQPLEDNGHMVLFQGRGQINLAKGDTVVLALPTNAIRQALREVKTVRNLTIINCSKGIDYTTKKLPHQIIQEILHPTTKYFALLGPSFANELKEKMPTIVNLGYVGDREEAQKVKMLFQTRYLRIHTVLHIESLELAGALKNIYAIACGMAYGLGFGMNTRIRILITAIEEFYILCKGLGYPIDEHAIGGITGDFILTGSSRVSRNFQFGQLLVKYPASEALKLINATVEGYASLNPIADLITQAQVTLPLADFVRRIVASENSESVRKQFLTFIRTV